VGDRAGAQPRLTRLGRTEKASSGSRVISCPVWRCPCARARLDEASSTRARSLSATSVSRSVAAGGARIYCTPIGRRWVGGARGTRFGGQTGGTGRGVGGGNCVAPSLGSPGAVHTSAVLCSSSTLLFLRLFRTGRGSVQLVVFKCCVVRDWFDWYKPEHN
jgi:hypothetical protein